MLSAGAAQAEKTDRTRERVTHMEIRRVQNGFLVQAVDYTAHHPYASMVEPSPVIRASYVAKNSEELATLITSVLDSIEVEWMPSVDIPMVDLRHHITSVVRENERLRKEVAAAQTQMVNPMLVGNPPPIVGSPIYGSAANTGKYP